MPPPRAAASSALEAVYRVSVVAALLLLFCYVASTVVITFVVAVIYAYVLEPLVSRLERLRMPRLLAILLALVSSLAVIGLLAYFLWLQVGSFQQDFPKYRHEVEELVGTVRGFLEALQSKTQAIVAPAPPPPEDAEIIAVQDEASPWVTWGGRLLGAVNAFVAATLVPFLTFFMLAGKSFFKERATALLCRHGLPRQRCETLLEDMNRQMRGFAIGKVFLHAVLAVLTTAALLVIGVDYAWIWGPLSALIALIPIFGFVLGMLPPMLIALIQFDSLAPVLWVVLAFVAIQFLETYVLTPKVVGMTINLNPLATLLAVLLFGWLWGAIGTVLALPITAVVKAFCDHVDGLREVGGLLGNPPSAGAEA
ncbi:MAG: AI-2E family transporter [Gemmatimonadota bacterium]